MALVDVIIGYAKGAQGDVGPQGPTGPQGPEGPQGPLPPLVNNALATEAGVAALDSAMGPTFQNQINTLNSNLTDVTINYPVKYKTKTYNSITLTGSPYAYSVLDTFAAIGVPNNKKVVGINVLGWENATGVFNVIKSTDGLSIILLAPAGTFGRVTVEVAYQ